MVNLGINPLYIQHGKWYNMGVVKEKKEKKMLMTYEFHLYRPRNGYRVVAIESGDSYTEALDKIHARYGAAWNVESGNLITVNA